MNHALIRTSAVLREKGMLTLWIDALSLTVQYHRPC